MVVEITQEMVDILAPLRLPIGRVTFADGRPTRFVVGNTMDSTVEVERWCQDVTKAHLERRELIE